jgi:phosphoenolpyruvate carboxykinase (ATP)
MKIRYTRAMIRAILDGKLSAVPARPDPIFGVSIPESVPGVPPDILVPRRTWRDAAAFEAKAHELARSFARNFEQFAGSVPREVLDAGPRLPAA